MADFTIPQNGVVCWRELQTKDIEKAKVFYTQMFGWDLQPSKTSPSSGYFEIISGGRAQGGMMEINEGWGEHWDKIPTNWNTYISVENCDETVEKILANGGAIMHPAFDAPGVGRMAFATDPSGAVFSVIQFVK